MLRRQRRARARNALLRDVDRVCAGMGAWLDAVRVSLEKFRALALAERLHQERVLGVATSDTPAGGVVRVIVTGSAPIGGDWN